MGPVLKRSVAVAVPCLLLLSGCGIAGTQFHPGVAAEVGARTISTDRVDELTAGFCDAVSEQIAADGQSYPLAGFKRGIVGQLALQSAAEQLAEEFDVQPGSDYSSQVTEIKTGAEGFPAESRGAYVEVQSTLPYITDVLTQIGAILLEKEGEDDPTVDFQQARGLDELETWAAREGFTFDPQYGLALIDGQPQPVDTDVSFALSDQAKAGSSSKAPEPTYVLSLPQSATCG